MGKTFDELMQYLGDMGIEVSTISHAAVFTVVEAQEPAWAGIRRSHQEFLFKDKKDNLFLVTVDEDAEVDLKTIHGKIGASSRVSFGKPEKLLEYLGLHPEPSVCSG